jgi:hypothetical protein
MGVPERTRNGRTLVRVRVLYTLSTGSALRRDGSFQLICSRAIIRKEDLKERTE